MGNVHGGIHGVAPSWNTDVIGQYAIAEFSRPRFGAAVGRTQC